MGWTILPYSLATGAAVVDTDMSAIADAEFTTRSSHYIFTEQYKLACAIAMGATGTRYNIQVPQMNAIGRFNIWPIMLSSANILSPPRVAWFTGMMPDLPTNEEVTIKATDGANENTAVFLMPMTPQHSKALPANQLIIPVRATASLTQVANGWSAPVVISMEQSLRGGVYSIIGGELVMSATAIWRLIFPRSRFYHGRRLRPGWLAQQAIGDLPEARLHIDPFFFGEWGRFHTFELPQVEVYSIAGAGAITAEIRLWLAYLGQDQSGLLDSWVSQGWQ